MSPKGKINFFNKIAIFKRFGEGLGRVLGGFGEGFGRVWGGFGEGFGSLLDALGASEGYFSCFW